MWDTFSIRCENNVARETIKHYANGFLTSKQDNAMIHGFGIRNIEGIAKTSDGFCNFETQNDTFVATVTLPYPTQKESLVCKPLLK